MNTFLIFIIIDAVIWLLFFGWFVLQISRAPEGWEDERGFHYGRRGDSTDRQASTGMQQSSRADDAPRMITLVSREDECA